MADATTVEKTEAEKQRFMLRFTDGTPMVTYLKGEEAGGGEWEMNWRTGMREQKGSKPKSQTPIFDSEFPLGTIIKLADAENRPYYVEVAKPKTTIAKIAPSMFANRLQNNEAEQKIRQGSVLIDANEYLKTKSL